MPHQRYLWGNLRDAFKPSQSREPCKAKDDLNPSIESFYCLSPTAYCLFGTTSARPPTP